MISFFLLLQHSLFANTVYRVNFDFDVSQRRILLEQNQRLLNSNNTLFFKWSTSCGQPCLDKMKKIVENEKSLANIKVVHYTKDDSLSQIKAFKSQIKRKILENHAFYESYFSTYPLIFDVNKTQDTFDQYSLGALIFRDRNNKLLAFDDVKTFIRFLQKKEKSE